MLEPVVAQVAHRETARLECLGRIEPAGGGAAAVAKGTVPQILDVLDIAIATSLKALFAVIKR